MNIKLNHLYHYAHRTGHGKYPYFIRIFTIVPKYHVAEQYYRFKHYNIKTRARGHSDITKTHLDFMFSSSEYSIRELTKGEKAKALLIGI